MNWICQKISFWILFWIEIWRNIFIKFSIKAKLMKMSWILNQDFYFSLKEPNFDLNHGLCKNVPKKIIFIVAQFYSQNKKYYSRSSGLGYKFWTFYGTYRQFLDYWIESSQLLLNWIIVWIEFWKTNIESNIELNQFLPKFKLWIESFWVSIMATPEQKDDGEESQHEDTYNGEDKGRKVKVSKLNLICLFVYFVTCLC